MPDVFLSYAREDRERARELAAALEGAGWSIWWDRKILAGDSFDETIEQQLDTAKCVVVLWSAHSVDSDWVKSEAAAASERDVLVPAFIERVKPPLEFRRLQAADLSDWSGDAADHEFQVLCDGIAARARVTAPRPRTPARNRVNWTSVRTRGAIAAAVIAVVGLGAFGVWKAADDDLTVSGVSAAAGNNTRDSPAPLAFELTGRWDLEVVPTGGLPPYRMTMDLESNETRLFGVVHYPTGDGGIQDGEIRGDRITFRTMHTPQFESAPAEIRFDGRVVGDTLELIVQSSTSTGRVKGTRQR